MCSYLIVQTILYLVLQAFSSNTVFLLDKVIFLFEYLICFGKLILKRTYGVKILRPGDISSCDRFLMLDKISATFVTLYLHGRIPYSIVSILKNRIYMPPMATGKTPDGFVTDALVDYYFERAQSGIAAVIQEHSYICPQGRAHAGQISIKYGFRGPNFGVVSACATSTNALIDAFNYVRLGKAKAIVTGGSEAPLFPAGVGGFNAMKAISLRNDDPEGASRPFSASRDGFVMGEGGVCLVFEELEHALARGAKIYGEVIGGGMSADAYHITASHPEGLGAKLVMQRAIEDAGIKAEDVDYVNAHGTSTPVGDLSEAQAVKDVFGEHAYRLNVSSTKSMTGHMLGATGAMEAVFCLLACRDDIVPPTINHADGDEDEHIDYKMNFTFNKAQKRTVNIALSNTFGFGGHNASIIVKKYQK